ncbi:hypothetical protein [Motiliproteus sp.]|uniref:hypothetical protein n=1 Tax=Motiliproteus sp. TaxID=1898955 RepID=UPI003BAB5306
MKPHKPLFNRRQLNLIIIVCVAAVALLSIDTNPWPDFERRQLDGVVLTHLSDAEQPAQLRLSFALPDPGLQMSTAALLLNELLQQRLQQAGLATQWQLQPHPDRLTLIHTPASTADLSDRLAQLLNALTMPFSLEQRQQQLALEQARRHLQRDQQSRLQRLDRQLRGDPALPTAQALETLQQQLFNQTNLRLALRASEIDSWQPPLQSWLTQLPPGQPWPPAETRTAPVAAAAPWQPLPGRNQGSFTQVLLHSRVLAGLSEQFQIQQLSSAQRSWRVWLPRHSDASLPNQLQSIQQRLNGMKDWEVRQLAEQIGEQLEALPQRPDALLEQLEVIAFYELPLDYLPRFEATIANLDGATLRQQLEAELSPERFGSETLTKP